MSHPFPDASFTVRPDELAALAGELSAVAADLADDADTSRCTAPSFGAALDGHAGWAAGATATAWGRLQEILSSRTGALAGTLGAAAAAYRAEDAALVGGLDAGRSPR